MTPKVIRKRVGLTLTELGERSGIDPARLSRWENQQCDLTDQQIKRVAAALNERIQNMPVFDSSREIFQLLTVGA